MSPSAHDLLLTHLPNHTFLPTSAPYEASLASYAYAQTRLRPTCIVKPTSTQDVAVAIGILSKSSTRFAVRGGGHGINPGFAGIEDGVTIDMRCIKSVQLDVGRMAVRVGAGAVWQDVYDVLEPRGYSVLGGRIGDVGVGGLVLGGGISFFSAARGWVCDSLLGVEIVFASGAVVEVDKESCADLFAALKGGGNNFGIVTRLDFAIFVQGPLWGGRITYESTLEVDKKLMDAFYQYKAEEFDEDTGMWLCFARLRSIGLRLTYTHLFNAKPEKQPGNLRVFVEAGPQLEKDLKVQYAGEITRGLTELSDTPEAFTIWSTNTFNISPTILRKVYDVWEKAADRAGDTVDTMAYTQSLPPSAPASNPNSLGVPTDTHPERDFVLFQTIFSYKDADLTDVLQQTMKDLVKDVDEAAKGEDVFVDWKYGNYAAGWQDVLGQDGRERLRSVSRKYDPDGMFQRQVVGGWKLFGEKNNVER